MINSAETLMKIALGKMIELFLFVQNTSVWLIDSMKIALEKMIELFLFLQNTSVWLINSMKIALEKISAGETMFNMALEKLIEWLHSLKSIVGCFIAWINQKFPLETRKEKLEEFFGNAKPFIIPGLVIVVSFWCCSRCSRCYRRREKATAKMMKAPGRNATIARSAFESNPKLYFRNLHKKKPM